MKQTDYKEGLIKKFQTFVICRMIPLTDINNNSLIYWRANVLFVILFTALVLCTFALIAAIALVIREQIWGLAIFDTLAYMICLGLLISSRPRLEIRSTVALLMCYIVGLGVIISIGPLSGGPIWLFTFAVLVGVLLGLKAAIVAVALNGITLVVIGWLIHTGRFGEAFPFFNTPEAMVAAGLNFIVLNIVVSMSVAMLVKGLVSTHNKEKKLSNRLEQEKTHLIEAKRDLELEVDERKQAEKALKDSEEKYRELANLLPQIVFETDNKGNIIFANRNAFNIFGYTENDLANGLNALQILIPGDHDKAIKNIQRVLTGENLGGVEYTAITNNGDTFPVVIYANRILQKEEAVGLRGIVIDLTKQKEVEKTLRESEEKYRNLFNNVQVGLGRIKISDGTVLESNEKMAQIFGFNNKEEFIKKFIFSDNYVDSGVREKMLNEVKKTDEVNNKVAQFYRKDGEIVWVRFDSRIYPEKGYMEDVVVDITEQKESEEERGRLESQLQQAQKMEAIGTLAGGIAHDFNNLLMGIQGRASLMLMSKGSSHPDFAHLKGIEEGVKSAADLTRQLLGFARGGKYEVKATNLNEIINKSTAMFGRTKKEVIIHKNAEKDLWTVEVDQGQIEQVLLNLYVNAWQAMSGTGELYLETGNVTLDGRFVKSYGAEPGRYAKISVTDTGIGMDKETQQRAFDPFFTTKEMSRGTGLGLASAYGIIKSHGGIINVYSKKGHGATFSIYLPASEKVVKKEVELPEEILKGSETVLFIDDEEMVIEIGQELLETLGYTVLLAKSGKEGIDLYKKNKDKIDMVLLDMIMPGLGGNETYDRLKEINPAIKALLSSGYSIDGLAKTILAKGCDGFIQKPFGLSGLSQKIREILDKK